MDQLVKVALMALLVLKALEEKWVLLDKKVILDYKEFRGVLENRD
jgi:hypothetical protein